LKTYLRKIVAFINDEEGASAIEYALLVGLIAVVAAGAAALVGNSTSGIFTSTATRVDSAGT
jgi:pilus assembly protein Flp/PilA